MNEMKTIRVVAAVIKAINEKGEPVIFATQRGYGEFKDGWEFPGGNFVLINERFNNFDTILAYIVFQIKSAEVSEALKCRKKIQ